MKNAEIAKILYEIGEYLEMKKIPFKPRAYQKAADGVAAFHGDIEAFYRSGGTKALKTIPGVGDSVAEKIIEYLETGKVKFYEEIRSKTPVNLGELRQVEGLGPQKIKILYERLGITNLEELKSATAAGKIRKLKGFGLKSEEKIKKGMEFHSQSGNRFVTGYLSPMIESLRSNIEKLEGVKRVVVAGSYRRRKDTIGDIDILVVSDHPHLVMDYFTAMPKVAHVIARGQTKSSVKLRDGINVDLRVVEEKSYGAALNYFTGSKDHNVALRELAAKRGLKLNEYGLFKGKKQIAGRTEEEIYSALKLHYVPPEMRENTGEIELASKNNLPSLIQSGDIRGDLQIQTDWTDGTKSILQMAEAAIKLGRSYIAITDHTKNLTITNGLNEAKLKRQMKEIDELNLKFKNQNVKFRILKGTECDILKDGRLDLPDEILKQLDVVGISVHSYFKLPMEEQTKRMKRAMNNPYAHILFHPTGRIINKRAGYGADMDEIIRHAKATKTVLEINSFPERSDLSAEHIRKCVDLGVKLAIDSDAHAPKHLELIEYGITQARRGWAAKKDIINAWPVEKMLGFLK